MTIRHSEASCDWCRRKIDDGADVACGKCQTDSESQIYGLTEEIIELKAKIDDLESKMGPTDE